MKLIQDFGNGDEDVQKVVLHKLLLDPSINHVSKSVLTETFNSKDWKNQSNPLQPFKDEQCVAMAQSIEATEMMETEIRCEMVVNDSSTDKDEESFEREHFMMLERLDDMEANSLDGTQNETEQESISIGQCCTDPISEVAIRFQQNLKQIVQLIFENKGKFPNDQERFMRILFVAIL